MPVIILKQSAYLRLKENVRKTLLLGQQSIEREKVRTYWETGRLINEYIRKNTPAGKERAEYNKEIVRKTPVPLPEVPG